MTNALKGESTLIVGTRKYKLRPCFEAIVALEEEVGSIIMMVDRIKAGDVKLREVTLIVQHGIWGFDTSKPMMELNDVGEFIQKAGYVELLAKKDEKTGEPVIAAFLVNAVTGGTGIARPTEEQKETTSKAKPRKK